MIFREENRVASHCRPEPYSRVLDVFFIDQKLEFVNGHANSRQISHISLRNEGPAQSVGRLRSWFSSEQIRQHRYVLESDSTSQTSILSGNRRIHPYHGHSTTDPGFVMYEIQTHLSHNLGLGSSYLSVSSFFFITGFLIGYSILRKAARIEKKNLITFCLRQYIRRYLR